MLMGHDRLPVKVCCGHNGALEVIHRLVLGMHIRYI